MRGIGARLRIDTGGPVRLRSTQDPEFMKGKTTVNEDELYIGAGNLPLRQKASKWASKPVVDGNTTEIDVLNFAREHLNERKLPELRLALAGVRTVISDCKPGEPCIGLADGI